ncbi:PaaX family transcriptional regulator [Actinomadura sp. LD22]|uniref:PaaX family transcriptional regulator n=1 Tax=Actinomadura physcomitrii TaxID=2650748 RepID=A0A6I4MJU2_9ACTN|nr:PaaX family transcriptional regulator C-terminal domain-containing protein [Actinomadura physcomitrii]MWA02919.1 PaaX family transcriptional regulator [Actinomadura physcomitrii]
MTRGAVRPARPRRVAPAGSAQSLLLTVLGEFVWPARDEVWTATLLRVLGAAGLGPSTTRQALSRAGARGWLESSRTGREVRWRLTAAGEELMASGFERVRSLTREPVPWDGRWFVLAVSVPHERTAIRRRLARRLVWAGFGSPAPGLWVSPHAEREAEVTALLDQLELRDQAISVVGPLAMAGMSAEETVHRAWDVGDLVTRYESLLAEHADYEPGEGEDLLVSHIGVVDAWQHLPYLDPQLPDALLPQPWPGRTAARLLERHRASSHQAAQREWRRLVAETAPARR